MIGKLTINGKDAWSTWGVFLEDGSYDKLLSGYNMKPYTENTSRAIDGKKVRVVNQRVESRDIVLVFCFAKTGSQNNFLLNLKSFISALEQGDNGTRCEIGVNYFELSEINSIFELVYLGNMSLNQTRLEIGKIMVRFNEPNPKKIN